MRSSRWLVGAALLVPTAATASVDQDLQVWATLAGSGSIKGDVVATFDASARIGDDLKRVRQTLTRGTIGVRVRPDLTLSLGYGHTTAYRSGVRDLAEERVYPQVNWTIGKLGQGTLSTRLRLEARFVRPGRDTGWRYRQLLRYQLPLDRAGGPSLVIQAEPFFALNTTDWGARAGFDQLRLMAGVSLPVSRTLSVETGYLAQYVNGRPRDRLNHVVPVTVALRF